MSSTLMALTQGNNSNQSESWTPTRPGADKGYEAPALASESSGATFKASLVQHLTSHGISKAEASEIASKIAPALEQQVQEYEKQGKGEAHVMFYPDRVDSVVIESGTGQQARAITNEGALAISMDTLKDFQTSGLSYDGLFTVTSELGSELKGMSDLDTANKFGIDVVNAIGQDGYPAESVAETKAAAVKTLESIGMQQPSVSDSQSLALLGEVVRNENDRVQLVDERTGKAAQVSVNDLRQELGFEFQAPANQQQTERYADQSRGREMAHE